MSAATVHATDAVPQKSSNFEIQDKEALVLFLCKKVEEHSREIQELKSARNAAVGINGRLITFSRALADAALRAQTPTAGQVISDWFLQTFKPNTWEIVREARLQQITGMRERIDALELRNTFLPVHIPISEDGSSMETVELEDA